MKLGPCLPNCRKRCAKKQAEQAQHVGETNKTEGEAFLAANKTKPGVVTLPSGLQYKILKEGTGPKPSESDSVVCNYRGTLVNGKEFDSSKPGEPITFPVNGVIKGWTEALQLMPVGSKWQLFIPSQLAYGERGAWRRHWPQLHPHFRGRTDFNTGQEPVRQPRIKFLLGHVTPRKGIHRLGSTRRWEVFGTAGPV